MSYRTGANQTPTQLFRKAAFEATPILVDGKLFLSTPYNHVITLEPQTGTKLWEYDPGVNLNGNYSEIGSRGVLAWRDPAAKPGAPCGLRIFIGTLDARLIALDGNTGKICPDFGSKGVVDLNQDAATQTVWTGGYQVTSPPAIFLHLVIVGSSIADNWRVDLDCSPIVQNPVNERIVLNARVESKTFAFPEIQELSGNFAR